MPSALVELAFITNVDDAKILRDKQDDLALSVAKGILNYLGIKYIEEKSNLVKIDLHGRELEIEGIVGNGVIHVPIRFIEQLGYSVEWKNGIVSIKYRKD